MSNFNNNRFTPGNKANMRSFINKAYYNPAYIAANDYLCKCIQQKANNIKQGWNDPSQTENMRISEILTGTLGGRTTFGNPNNQVFVSILGGREGQPGGLPRPLRNKF